MADGVVEFVEMDLETVNLELNIIKFNVELRLVRRDCWWGNTLS